MATWIFSIHRVIIAVRKHIVPQEALAGAAVGIGVEEPLDDGIVISALQIVEPGFRGVVVAIEAKMGSIGLLKKRRRGS